NGSGTNFSDPKNPILQPAKQVDSGKKKSWKRKLISLCLVMLLIGGAAVALYLLLRVNRVNVRVDADARRESVNAENVVTAEAIDIARAASGPDTGSVNRSNSTISPNGSPTPTPSPGGTGSRNLAYTGNFSPVNEKFDNNRSSGDGNQQQNGGNQQQTKVSESANLQLQNHANTTNSIYVDDSIATPTPATRTSTASLNQARAENKLALTATA